jgi:hypothetical protein
LLDQHELNDVELLILDPVFVEFLQYAPNLVDELYNRLIALFLAYALIGLLGVVE